jgi:hypothetical protein
MVAIDDADKDTLPRGTVNSDRIQRAIAGRLVAGGYAVYDEAHVVPDLPPARTKRSDAQLLAGAKLVKTPVDVIIVSQVYSWIALEPKMSGAFRPSISVDVHYLRVRDGQYLGNYSSGRVELPLIEGECAKNGECLRRQFGDDAERSAAAMGDAIAAKLAADLRSPGASPTEGKDNAAPVPR